MKSSGSSSIWTEPVLSLPDPNGNLTNDGTNTYTFDAENRLMSTQQTANSTQYTYDAFGQFR